DDLANLLEPDRLQRLVRCIRVRGCGLRSAVAEECVKDVRGPFALHELLVLELQACFVRNVDVLATEQDFRTQELLEVLGAHLGGARQTVSRTIDEQLMETELSRDLAARGGRGGCLGRGSQVGGKSSE